MNIENPEFKAGHDSRPEQYEVDLGEDQELLGLRGRFTAFQDQFRETGEHTAKTYGEIPFCGPLSQLDVIVPSHLTPHALRVFGIIDEIRRKTITGEYLTESEEAIFDPKKRVDDWVPGITKPNIKNYDRECVDHLYEWARGVISTINVTKVNKDK